MVISKKEIENVIPTKAPFVMVDNLLEASQNVFKTDFLILPDNIFLENSILREFALIENIAQSSAASVYYLMKDIGIESIDGFMAAISKLKLFQLPKVNDRITTKVTLLLNYANMFLVCGECYKDDIKLLECEIKFTRNENR